MPISIPGFYIMSRGADRIVPASPVKSLRLGRFGRGFRRRRGVGSPIAPVSLPTTPGHFRVAVLPRPSAHGQRESEFLQPAGDRNHPATLGLGLALGEILGCSGFVGSGVLIHMSVVYHVSFICQAP